MKDKHLATAVILCALVATGCTNTNSSGDVSVSQKKGVAVTSFQADPQNVLSGQTFFLRLELENKGSSQAQNVQAKILDPVFGTGPRSPKIQSESDSVYVADSSKRLIMDFGNLRAPDPETGTDPLPRTKTANPVAPSGINAGIKFPIDLVARIYYEYQTTANTQITLMSPQQFRNKQPERTQVSVDNTGGPVQISINEQSPVRVDSGATKSICLVVQNVGSGRTIDPEAYGGAQNPGTQRENLGKVKLSLKTGSGIKIQGSNTVTVRLVGSDKKGQHCFTAQPNYVSTSGGQQTVLLTATAEYAYYTGAETSFTVEGRETTSSTSTGSSTSSTTYVWTGSDEQLNQQQSNYGVNTVDALCSELKKDNAAAFNNCETQ